MPQTVTFTGTFYGISRNDAITILSQIRYPGSQRQIGRTTLWRWRDLLGLKPRTQVFYEDEMEQLKEVARHYAFGGTESQLIERLKQKKAEVN
ncbi:MAG: hypothetical protein F6J95_031025 [Leptolyngbya sp. SIO1E4]|nr:hypothetical protein [Leptolyngbya sp. SIO1E4]